MVSTNGIVAFGMKLFHGSLLLAHWLFLNWMSVNRGLQRVSKLRNFVFILGIVWVFLLCYLLCIKICCVVHNVYAAEQFEWMQKYTSKLGSTLDAFFFCWCSLSINEFILTFFRWWWWKISPSKHIDKRSVECLFNFKIAQMCHFNKVTIFRRIFGVVDTWIHNLTNLLSKS